MLIYTPPPSGFDCNKAHLDGSAAAPRLLLGLRISFGCFPPSLLQCALFRSPFVSGGTGQALKQRVTGRQKPTIFPLYGLLSGLNHRLF